jgi:hypothetical protein
MKALIIDLSCKGEVKILNTRITSSVSVISGYYLTLGPEDDAVAAAAVKLRDETLTGLPAYIIPPVGLVNKTNFSLPKMPDKEIRKVLPREIAAEADSQEPMIFNYFKNGAVEERQVEKQEVSAFYCPRQTMFDYLTHLKEHGIQPVSMIPEMQGLKTLTGINPKLSGERSGVVFLELMDTRINLNIFKFKYWGLEREFMYRMGLEGHERDDDLSDEEFTRISTELNRTFQFFKQKNRGYSLDQVVLYGTSGNIEPLRNLINDNLPVTAAAIQPEYFGSKVSFPSHLRDSREFISIFTLPIATALAVSGKKFVDVFPIEYKERAKLPRRLIGFSVSAAIIGAILISATIYFEGIKGSYKQDIRKIQRTYANLNTNAGQIAATKKQRADFFKRRYYLDFPMQYSYGAANFIRKLSLISADDIRLTELELKPGGQTFTFKLDGWIKAGDNIGAQSRFLEFYRKLKDFEEIIDATSSNVAVNPRGSRTAGGGKAAGKESPLIPGSKDVVLYFTINGEVEPE